MDTLCNKQMATMKTVPCSFQSAVSDIGGDEYVSDVGYDDDSDLEVHFD